MKKEVVIAIIVGFALGLVITFGIYTAQKALKNRQMAELPATETDTGSESEHSLSITQPENESLVEAEEVMVSGITTPGSSVMIIATADETITTADEQGNFSVKVELSGGVNTIQVTSFDAEGNQAQEELTLVFSTQFDQSASEENEEEE